MQTKLFDRNNCFILSVVLICIMVAMLTVAAQKTVAGCYVCGKVKDYFIKKENLGLANDFYIYYLIPKGASFSFTGATQRAKDTLAKSTYARTSYNKTTDKIDLIAGAKARAFSFRYSGDEQGIKAFISEICCRYYDIYCYMG